MLIVAMVMAMLDLRWKPGKVKRKQRLVLQVEREQQEREKVKKEESCYWNVEVFS